MTYPSIILVARRRLADKRIFSSDHVVPKLNAIKRWASELEMFPRSQSESIDHIWVASYYNQDYNTLLHQYYAMYKTPSQINANEGANIEYEVSTIFRTYRTILFFALSAVI
jgi:hypothetical protein